MTPRDFCFWLQGYFELTEAMRDSFTNKQLEIVKQHLGLVFKHDPAMAHPPVQTETPDPQKIEKMLEELRKQPRNNKHPAPFAVHHNRDTLYC